MRRIGTIGLLSAITACNGGAPEVGRAAIERSQAAESSRVVTVSASRARDGDAPRLETLTGSGRMAVPGVVGGSVAAPTGSMPPSGGYVMRTPHAAPPVEVTAMAAPTTTTPYAGRRRGVAMEEPAPRAEAAATRGGGAVAMAPMHHAASRAPSSTSASGGGFGAAADATNADGTLAPAAVTALPPGTRITVSVSGPSPVAPPPAQDPQQVATALTAATVGDSDRRENYLEYLSRHAGEAEELGIDMTRRVSFRVVDASGHPVNNAEVTVAGGQVRAQGHTHADGSWDFYPSVAAAGVAGGFGVHAQVENVGMDTTFVVPARGDTQGPIVLRIPAVVQAPAPALDLSFLIDVTGSMGDELGYVNREVGSIVQRIEAQSPGVRVRVSATFYRDRMDDVQLQQIPFTTNVAGFADAMRGVSASGGGDYPEDMNAGLEAAMDRLAWSDGAAVRVVVLIADAPPQPYGDEQYTYHSAMSEASRRGIRILPVAASGSDRAVEYLFRAMGAYTSTPYVYLTDDSGVGAPHMEADTDRVGVERFADLLTRLVTSDLRGQGMHEPGPLGPVG